MESQSYAYIVTVVATRVWLAIERPGMALIGKKSERILEDMQFYASTERSLCQRFAPVIREAQPAPLTKTTLT